jgi:NADPH-dependent 2,4-dienoyl-CoA reductase/sulfur reductase-like enzyme
VQSIGSAVVDVKLAALNALNGDAQRYNATAMPMVTFTDPQAASVGLTEAAARAQGIDVKTSVLPLDQVPRALAARDTRGLIKLVADPASDRLLGAHILAPEGCDSIQTAALAIKYGHPLARRRRRASSRRCHSRSHRAPRPSASSSRATPCASASALPHDARPVGAWRPRTPPREPR